MALKEAAKRAAGKFEQDAPPGAAVTEKPAAPAEAAQAAAGVTASTAIAKAAAGAVAVGGQFKAVFTQFRDALPAVEFGVLPRLVGSNGNIMDKDSRVLGAAVELQLVSWNDTFVVSPGTDNDEADELVRYSRDGKTIEGTGESVDAYLKKLREVDGYDKANVKHYVELIGILTAADKPSDHVGNMVQVSLSPQSRKTWDGYQLQESVKVAQGRRSAEGIDQIVVRAEVKTVNGKTFTLLRVTGK